MLYDVDKNSEDRGSPMPNTHDTVIQGAHKAHGTLSGNYTSDATPANPNSGIFGSTATFIQSGTASVSYSGSAPLTNTTTVAHNLGFAPAAVCFLNNASINGSGNVNLQLPTWLSLTNNFGGTPPAIIFQRWMDFSTDSTNIYINTYDSIGTGGGSVSVTVTFYLYRLPASK